MKQIVECVPNFSEGRDQGILDQISEAVRSVDNVQLLDVDPGADTNRTVFTFVGEPDAVMEAAFRAIKKASELIDMSKHSGAHPRMGATDVCPFIPVSNITMEQCVEVAKTLGKRVGEELEIPVYLYEYAATKPERRNLATVRKGEYEGLPEKLENPEWAPDFGPARFNERAGATAVGVREFLIAYNVTLNTREKKYATDIALELREKGRPRRVGNIQPFYTDGTLVKHRESEFFCGTCDYIAKTREELFTHCKDEHGYDLPAILDEHGMSTSKIAGKATIKPGLFKNCKAIGWYVDEYHRVQISINLTNYKITAPHEVLEATRNLAADRGLVVTGSEVVGLIPYNALLQSGVYYLEKQGKSAGIPIDDILQTAVDSMGLNDVSPFHIHEKVLGYPDMSGRKLVNMTATDLVHEISRDTPAPGGGSVSALSSAMGAGLASMVAGLTLSKKQYASVKSDMAEIGTKAQSIKDSLLKGVDDDTDAFNAYFGALKMPKKTPAEKEKRESAMQNGLKQAVEVPLKTAQESLGAIGLCLQVVEKGNVNSVTDGGVGAETAYAGLRGAILNILINLPGIHDANFVSEMKSHCKDLIGKGDTVISKVRELVLEKIESM
ncbi:MAG: glutamate formimidoyltransferase [Holophagae bacterium]|nr:glutamate formimidoyltransferase [Holophagae bacterium]